MRTPTKEQVEAAKEFVRRRVEAEVTVRKNLDGLLYTAARLMVAASYKYCNNPMAFSFSYSKRLETEIDKIALWLILNIEDSTLTAATASDEDKKEAVMPMLTGESYGKTLNGRITEYVRRYRNEIEVAIAAALVLGIGKDMLLHSVRASRYDPLGNPIVREAEKKGKGIINRLGFVTKAGNNLARLSRSALRRLITWIVSKGWMLTKHLSEEEEGAIGYIIYRGSTYPCDFCDEAAGKFHYMTDGATPPLHANCKCYIVYVHI